MRKTVSFFTHKYTTSNVTTMPLGVMLFYLLCAKQGSSDYGVLRKKRQQFRWFGLELINLPNIKTLLFLTDILES